MGWRERESERVRGRERELGQEIWEGEGWRQMRRGVRELKWPCGPVADKLPSLSAPSALALICHCHPAAFHPLLLLLLSFLLLCVIFLPSCLFLFIPLIYKMLSKWGNSQHISYFFKQLPFSCKHVFTSAHVCSLASLHSVFRLLEILLTGVFTLTIWNFCSMCNRLCSSNVLFSVIFFRISTECFMLGGERCTLNTKLALDNKPQRGCRSAMSMVRVYRGLSGVSEYRWGCPARKGLSLLSFDPQPPLLVD